MTQDQTENNSAENKDWYLFYGDGSTHQKKIDELPPPPPWRKFLEITDIDKLKELQKIEVLDNSDKLEELQKIISASKALEDIKKRWKGIKELANSPENKRGREKGQKFCVSSQETEADDDENTNNTKITVLDAVNAALYLRRPLLVTGNPGSGKTSLAYAIAYELQLGPVLSWAITSRSTLQDGLYAYDAIARLQDSQLITKPEDKKLLDIGRYITLGPLGTAFLPSLYPRVLLIDEIDKSDINLPNDLLHLFEEGKFQIPELVRWADTSKTEESQTTSQTEASKTVTVRTEDLDIKAVIKAGRVHCSEFPIIIMTSNGERDFPPAFVRRCLRVRMPDPDTKSLKNIIASHFKDNDSFKLTEEVIDNLITNFKPEGQEEKERATDQLLNAIYIRNNLNSEAFTDDLRDLLFKSIFAADEP